MDRQHKRIFLFGMIAVICFIFAGFHIKYLKENMNVMILLHEGKIIGVDIPAHVELEVVDTPRAEKGNTAQGGTKPATLETGAVVQVPFFVSNGDVIRVDTRSNEYLDRV